ncbi:tetratricopeptide repeat protein [Streptomyces sp. NPDC048442]|uniref:tetratricopeptide repeat protein n=1 Tax=Streptomyces sp. NPDC048442 TaxID=3154823 RepID=UPI00343ABF85
MMPRPELVKIDQHTRLSLALAKAGDYEPAIRLGREAMWLARRELVADDGVDTRLALAASLHNLALVTSWHGLHEEALRAADEAVGFFRDIAAEEPDLGRPRLADSLDSLGTRLADLGRPEDALPLSREAVALFRGLDPTGHHRAELARCLHNMAVRLTDTGRHEEAFAALTEALDIHRTSVEALDIHRTSVEALDIHRTSVEALDIHRTSVPDGPADHREVHLHIVARLAKCHAALGNDTVVPLLALESVQLVTLLPADHRARQSAELLDHWRYLARHLARTGYRTEARQVKTAARRLRWQPHHAEVHQHETPAG